MPWSNNHLPKYRKHRSSGQAVVTLNGRDSVSVSKVGVKFALILLCG
ncbi:hypothetical protein [Bythopirellula polymerisocia]|uniref:Uncharacterized protein n=1 Tax=Bythopirellula polymerisocia TaxID=2528003 RepID=A0A5C6C8B8_9BACT|nr:hypothetical protein [Bythopirellula polymerisocia]TWU20913.1 hypothetical protein Pla144_48140 [Bythopirellula polymerisocia]